MEGDFSEAVQRALSAGFHTRAEYDAYRRLLIEHDISEAAKDFQCEGNPKATVYARLLDAISADARDFAITQKLDAMNFDHLLSEVRSVPYDLLQATQHPFGQRSLDFWKHVHSPRQNFIKGQYTDLDPYGLNETTVRYLALPIRTGLVERTLLDVLAAQRVFESGRRVYGYPEGAFVPPREPLRRWHPAVEWLHAIVSLTLLFLGASFLARSLSVWPGDGWSIVADWAMWLWFIFGGLALLNLPFLLSKGRRERAAAEATLSPYLAFYSELGEVGPWSSRHLWESAHRTASEGAVWPAALYTLLDDRNGRDGRV